MVSQVIVYLHKFKFIIMIDTLTNQTKLLRGVYKITNLITNDLYIGSTKRTFLQRLAIHKSTYKNLHSWGYDTCPKVLRDAFIKYGFDNFKFEILEIINDDSLIRFREEYYIKTLSPKYNLATEPTKGGSPNKNRKLSEEWKFNIRIKSSEYKHSEETLKKVTDNNKNNAVRLILKNETETLTFNSIVEAGIYFGVGASTISTAYYRNKEFKGYSIEKISSQKKQISVVFEDEEKTFKSFNECDRFLNMWRGYTSTKVLRNELLMDKYSYKLK